MVSLRCLRVAIFLACVALTTTVQAHTDIAAGRAAFSRGTVAYRAGQLDRAIEEFRLALRLTGRAQLLYNIALCQEGLQDPGGAAESYGLYLRAVPDAPQRVEIEGRIEELKHRAGAIEDGLGAGVPMRAAGAPVATLPSPALEGARPRRLRTAAIALGAVTGGILIAGAGSGGAALVRYEELRGRCPDNRCAPELEDSARGGAHMALATDVLIGIGVGAAAAALVVGILSVKARRAVERGGVATGAW